MKIIKIIIIPIIISIIFVIFHPTFNAEETNISQWAIESIHLNDAWEFTTGSDEILVGIIDSGIDSSHPDLQDLIEYDLCMDFTSGTGVSVQYPTDSVGHGTMVAGIIGSANTLGIKGVNRNIRLVSLKVVANDGSISISSITQAILYAENQHIDVLNISIGWTARPDSTYNNEESQLISAITSYSGVIVCSAGNDGANNDLDNPNYPSSYSNSNIIAVGAIDNNDERYLDSNYGETTVDLFAPGVDILSTYPLNLCLNNNDGQTNYQLYYYHSGDGTSLAAPYVTGLICLLLSINNLLSQSQIKQVLVNSADIINIKVPNTDPNSNSTEPIFKQVKKINAYESVKYTILNYLNPTSLTLNDNFNDIANSVTISDSTASFNDANGFIKLNVSYEKYYEFNLSSNNSIEIKLYNDELNELSYNDFDISLNRVHFIKSFAVGNYYLLVRYNDRESIGTINYRITSNNSHLIGLGSNDILVNSYNNVHSYVFNSTYGSGLYKFTLNASNTTYPEGSISIYKDYNRTELMKCFDDDGSYGITQADIAELYVYLPDLSNYYIDVNYELGNCQSFNIEIQRVETNNLSYNNSLISTQINEIFTGKVDIAYYEEVVISHRSKIELDIQTLGLITNNIPIYVYKRFFNNTEQVYYLEEVLNGFITSINHDPVFSIILDKGTYYVGFSENNDNISIQLMLRRVVQNNNNNQSSTLVSDPALNQGFTLGSEVMFNNGILQGNTITEGFTRCLYLMVENRLLEPMSRLDYDWYSSNNNVATVSAYGTVLAFPVISDINVRIYAVLKSDPSVVYYKDFVILNDVSETEIVIQTSIIYSRGTSSYHLPINSNNSPYPLIQYYQWSVSVPDAYNINVELSYWGIVTSDGNGIAMIIGHYTLNPRVYVVFNMTIID